MSLKSSHRAKNLSNLVAELERLVPDLSHQYTNFKLDMSDPYIRLKLRGQHAFQVSMALKAFERISDNNRVINIVDIGDSSGTHLIYLRELFANSDYKIEVSSVNTDPVAVERIRKRGLAAIECKAEDLHKNPEFNRSADLFLSFEMLEHLLDPVSFLRNMAVESECKLFALTVPLVKKSRVGVHHIRRKLSGKFSNERVHIFELCPDDWKLLFNFSGWEVVLEDRYTQYPEKGMLNLTKFAWRRIDFDGFYGVVLRKNLAISNQYTSW